MIVQPVVEPMDRFTALIIMETLSVEVTYQLPAARPNAAAAAAVGCAVRSSELLMTQHISS